MHFVIFCIDKPGINRDPAVMQAHIDYLNNSPVKNVMSGPLTGDDGEGIIGSLIIVQPETKKANHHFQKAEPYLERTIGKL